MRLIWAWAGRSNLSYKMPTGINRFGYFISRACFAMTAVILVLPLAVSANDSSEWMSTQEFLDTAFGSQDYQPQVLWFTPELRTDIEDALDRKYPGIRIRYWGNGKRSAWILEQIGKERLITSGFVTEQGQIIEAHVLTYRESRGGEIGYASFRNRLSGLELNEKQKLSKYIDGITGATLSVRSMKKMAVAALLLDKHAHKQTSLARN